MNAEVRGLDFILCWVWEGPPLQLEHISMTLCSVSYMRHLGCCKRKKRKAIASKLCLKATAIRGGKPEKQLKVPPPASGSPAGLVLFIGEKLGRCWLWIPRSL